MLKRTLTLMATGLIALNASAASTFTQYDHSSEFIECYDLAHGENGQGSTNSVFIPPFTMQGSSQLDVMVSNIGQYPVNVKLKLFDENGVAFEPTDVEFEANFTATNNPITKTDGSGAAILSSNKLGYVRIDSAVNTYYTGILSWQVDACLTEPTLSVNIGNFLYNGNVADRGIITVNGGNPF